MIQTENLTKNFMRNEVGFEAVSDITMHVEKGQFIGVIGHSGSGKTTLFNLLGGLIRPTSGSITVAGKDITALPEKELADYRNQTIGYILQGHSMLYNFTVLDNICMPAYLARDKRTARKKARELLEDIGLGHLENEYPKNLSGGEMRRVSIARAMLNEPAVILADEPTSNLDPENSRKVMELLKQVNKSGATILISTHEMKYLEYTDDVYEMKEGILSYREGL